MFSEELYAKNPPFFPSVDYYSSSDLNKDTKDFIKKGNCTLCERSMLAHVTFDKQWVRAASWCLPPPIGKKLVICVFCGFATEDPNHTEQS